MSLRYVLGGILGLLAAWPAGAQPPLQAGRITLPEVEVRAIPSPKSPSTGKLRMGDTVQIKGKVNDYLEIVPPPGSYSWIQDRLVAPLSPRILALAVEEAPVRYGSASVEAPLEIESRVRIKKGTQLAVRGDKLTFQGASWWPIEPIPGESRYIPAEAISPTMNPAVEAVPPASAPMPTTPGGPTDPQANRPSEWRLAEQAERDGRYDEAIRLYTELCRLNSQPGGDFTLAVLCQNRIRELRSLRRSGGALTSRTNPTPTPRTGGSGSYPPVPPLPGAGGPGRTTSVSATATEGARSSGPGYLRRTAIQVDGQTSYALENSRGDLLLYITPEPSLNLEPFLNRLVELYGPIRNRGDVRGASHMYANRVVQLR